MVLRFINSRLSLAPRLMLLAAVLAVPVVLLCGLFVKQSWRDIAIVDRELQGVAYLSAIWPLYEQAAAGAPVTAEARRRFAQARDRFDPEFWTPALSAAFDSAESPRDRVARGQALIRAVADRSNLVLDPQLDSFYLVVSVVERLPALLKAAADLGRAEPGAGAPAARMYGTWDQVEDNAAAAEASLAEAMGTNREGVTLRALAAPSAQLRTDVDALTAQATAAGDGASPGALRLQALRDRLERHIGDTWRASLAELTRLLEARRLRLLTALWTSLAVVLGSLGVSAAIGWAIVSGLDLRARGLLSAIGRLVEGDLSVAIPYRDDPGEIGRIAGGVQSLKQATEERARLGGDLERANRELRDQRAWLKLSHEVGRMGAWRRRLPGDQIEVSPELAQLMGFPADAPPQFVNEIEPLLADPNHLKRYVEEQERLALGELDPALRDRVVAIRRRDTGEVRWFMLRRELVEDPQRQTREIIGVAIDFTNRKHMMDELNHRVKNNLATVLSLAMQTAKSTDDTSLFVKLFTGRLQALAKINELLTRHAWADVQVRDVVITALRPWLGAGLEVLGGSPPDLAMSARAAVSLCLVLHELGSRAERLGALAADGGKATIVWSGPDPEHGLLIWTEERPGRPETPGGDRDADTRLIERLVRGDLGGRADFDVRPDGLRVEISFALAGATA
jgi:two-component sensor histidine kinase